MGDDVGDTNGLSTIESSGTPMAILEPESMSGVLHSESHQQICRRPKRDTPAKTLAGREWAGLICIEPITVRSSIPARGPIAFRDEYYRD